MAYLGEGVDMVVISPSLETKCCTKQYYVKILNMSIKILISPPSKNPRYATGRYLTIIRN